MIMRREGETGATRYGSSGAARVFGGSPFGVLIRLALLCVVVGLVLDQLDLNAFDLFHRAVRAVEELFANSAELLRAIGRYFLIGAMVVIPIWILVRVFSVGTGRR